jgi:hypothetical protein
MDLPAVIKWCFVTPGCQIDYVEGAYRLSSSGVFTARQRGKCQPYSTVAIAAEVLKQHGCYDPKRLMGVTNLDVMRARTFVADAKVGVYP